MTSRRRLWSPVALIGLAAVLVASALLGGYLDWVWWHPTRSIVISLAAIVALIAGGLTAWLARGRGKRVGAGLLAVGAGLLLGMLLGPEREPVSVRDGEVTLTLTSPVAATVEASAFCSIVPSGDHLAVSADVNMRLPMEGEPAERHPFLSASASAGDMWAPETGRRSDELVVLVIASRSFDLGAEGSGETRWHSTPNSTLDYSPGPEVNSGAISFSGLELTEGSDGDALPAGPMEGSISWTCERTP